MDMHFEGGIEEFLYRLTMVSTCDLEITIYGAAGPPKVRLNLRVEDGALKVMRVA
jgi:hypothetical protein